MMWKLCHNFWLLLLEILKKKELQLGLGMLHAASFAVVVFYLFYKSQQQIINCILRYWLAKWSSRVAVAAAAAVVGVFVDLLSQFLVGAVFPLRFWPWAENEARAHYLLNGKLLLFAAIKYHWVMAGVFRCCPALWIETFSGWRGSSRGKEEGGSGNCIHFRLKKYVKIYKMESWLHVIESNK